MAPYRAYWRLLYSSLAIVILAFFTTAIYLEPNSGDLTRMGGYPENWHGWTLPQTRFARPLYSLDTYDRYYDAVVLGDSFSTRHTGEQTDPGSYWQNFLARDTGLSVVTFDLRKADFRSIIKGPVYTKRPPRIFIFENIERDIVYIPEYTGLKNYDGPCTPRVTPAGRVLETTPFEIEPLSFDRSIVYRPNTDDFPFLDLDQAANVWKKRFLQDALGIANQTVGHVNLVRSDLFSSRHSDKLLFYKNELLKRKWRAPLLQSVYCKLLALQNLIQSNGETFFLLMIVPDRLTAYDPYVKDSTYTGISKLNTFVGKGLHLVRLDLAISRLIAEGMPDVYLPNDTHWGVRGHMLAAQESVRTLRRYNIIH